MNALIATGKNEPISLQELPSPTPSTDETLVQIKAAALNHRDLWILKGMYTGLKFPSVLGSDGAGITTEGKEVIINPSLCYGANPEDKNGTYQIAGQYYRSLGMPKDGTFAEYMTVPSENIFPKPKHLTFEEAAALPLAGLTAWRALMTKCQPKAGEKVLISGIGGGVALFAMQFAVATGAEVYVTSSSEEKIARAMQSGAKGGALYSKEGWAKDFGKATGGFDVVIDSAAGNGFPDLIRLCNQEARVCFYGGTRGVINNLNVYPIFWNQLSIMGSTMGTKDDFTKMLRFVNKHKIIPIVDSVFNLQQGADAFERMEKGEQFGKIILTI